MKPKHIFLVILLGGLLEILLFLVFSKTGPMMLWQGIENFALGKDFSLGHLFQGMLFFFLILMSVSYLVFKGKEKQEEKTLISVLEEKDYAAEKVAEKEELEQKEKEIKIAPKLPPIILDKEKDYNPHIESPPPGAPPKRPPNTNRKLL